jgi:hypothetical protein
MRIQSIIPVLVIMLAPIFGWTQSDLQGAWLIDYETDSGPIEILLELMEGGEHQIDLGNDGIPDIKGVWTVEGDQVTMGDEVGEVSCQDDTVFAYKLEGETLTFTAVKDPCQRVGPKGFLEFTRKE